MSSTSPGHNLGYTFDGRTAPVKLLCSYQMDRLLKILVIFSAESLFVFNFYAGEFSIYCTKKLFHAVIQIYLTPTLLVNPLIYIFQGISLHKNVFEHVKCVQVRGY